MLLSEIHHRVKNNLAVISGLLYLQADKTDDENAFKALRQSQNRINSMALIQELLYNDSTFSQLNPKEYIEQLIEHISSNLRSGNTNITTTIQADDFDLDMATAIPCALIVNELITNAHKYAFKEQEAGEIDVILIRKGPRKYHLEVGDSGCGLPSDFDIRDKRNHNLGLSLVKTLTRQLHGTIEAKNDAGARFIINFEEKA